ncbi:MAG: WD40 repeat domain-containing protein [Anaerolineaceae bacterium]|nr:WD40 repeat domain-containing protein [Anaerolineaceae bacterium]
MKSIVNFTAGCFCLFLALFNPGVGKMQSSIDETITQIVFNDNGSRIAVATNFGVKIYDQNFVMLASLTSDVNKSFHIYAWHPDGQRIFINGEYYDSATLTRSNTQDEFSTFSPNGRLALQMATDELGGYLIYDMMNRSLINRIAAGEYFEELTWSYDGAYLAAATGTYIVVMDVFDANHMVRIPIDGQTYTIAWNSVNYQIAAQVTQSTIISSTEQTTTESIQIFDAVTGSNIQRIESTGDLQGNMYWTPDGRYFISQIGSNTFSVRDSITYQVAEVFNTPEPIGATALSPYGGRLLYGTYLPLADNQSSLIIPSVYLPVPSDERLDEIIKLCGLAPGVEESLSTQALTAQLTTLPSGAIPPGCAADLIAVAQALQAQGE